MTTTIEELERWMQVPKETEGLEFKAARESYSGGKLMDYCVGIANDGGGKLVLGVTDKPPRKVVGTPAVNDPAGMQKKILDTINFDVRIEELKHPKGRVVICHIPRRPKGMALHHDGKYLMRSGEELRAMTPERLREIFAEGNPDWVFRSAREDCSASDVVRMLDTEAFHNMLSLPYPAARGAVLRRLEMERLITVTGEKYSITNLGAILFAKRLDDFEGLARKAPRVAVYDGLNKLKPSRVFQPGTKGYAIGFKGLINFINNQIPTNEVIGKVFRDEVKMFPEIAIRELVANALIHQDFSEIGTSVMIDIYTDRIEISNPGKSIISTERFVDEVQSRNETLAGLMRRLRICEEQGLGIDRVVAAAEMFQLPAPYFGVGEKHTLAVMYAHKQFEEMDSEDKVRACFQHCVLRWVMNQKMTNGTLRERFNLPESKSETVSRIINETMLQGKIKPNDPASTSKRYASYVPYWTTT
jgi:ATP-dependent DNA helicase RecG